MQPLIEWILTHQQTVIALMLTFLVAFVAGEACQYYQDDKKATSHANVK